MQGLSFDIHRVSKIFSISLTVSPPPFCAYCIFFPPQFRSSRLSLLTAHSSSPPPLALLLPLLARISSRSDHSLPFAPPLPLSLRSPPPLALLAAHSSPRSPRRSLLPSLSSPLTPPSLPSLFSPNLPPVRVLLYTSLREGGGNRRLTEGACAHIPHANIPYVHRPPLLLPSPCAPHALSSLHSTSLPSLREGFHRAAISSTVGGFHPTPSDFIP